MSLTITQINGYSDYNVGCCCSFDGSRCFYFKLNGQTSLDIVYTIDSFNSAVMTDSITIPILESGKIYFSQGRFVIANADCTKIIVSINTNGAGDNNYPCFMIDVTYGVNVSFALSQNDMPSGTCLTGAITADGNKIAIKQQRNMTIELSLDSGVTWETIDLSAYPDMMEFCPMCFTNNTDMLLVASNTRLYTLDTSSVGNSIVYKSIIGGDNPIYSITCNNNIYDVPFTATDIYAVNGFSQIFKSINGGTSFNSVTSLNRGIYIASNLNCSFLLTWSSDYSNNQYSLDSGTTWTAPITDSVNCACAKYDTEISGTPYPNMILFSGAGLYYATLPACFCKNSVVFNKFNELVKVKYLKENDIIKTMDGFKQITKIKGDKIPIEQADYILVLRKDKLGNKMPFKDLYITKNHFLFFENIKNYTNENYNPDKYKNFNNKNNKLLPLLANDCNLMEKLNENDIKYLNEDGFITLYNIQFNEKTNIKVNNVIVNSL